ncbi:hypothetical protein ACMYSQ_009342 [Aspergillus niger]
MKDPHMKERASLATRKRIPRPREPLDMPTCFGRTDQTRTNNLITCVQERLSQPASQGEQPLRLPEGSTVNTHQLIVWLVASTETSVVRPYASGALTPSREKDERQSPGEGARNSLPSSQQVPQPIEDREPVIRGD